MVILLMLLAGLQLGVFTSASGNPYQSVPLDSWPLKSEDASESKGWTLYDPDPNHIWNRLYRALYQRVARNGREYGYDELDPILWPTSKYLLAGQSYQKASTLLDEFLSTHAEDTVKDPLKRVIFQRDLWAIFDWTTEVPIDSPEKLNLQIKLAEVMKRLALSRVEILSLPDSYKEAATSKEFAATYDLNKRERPFLPPDLFDPQGPWVKLSGRGSVPIAMSHVDGSSGRSVFLVFMLLPGGRDATLKYLEKLSEFPKPWIPDQDDPRRLLPNPDLPQFPVGTQLALVRMIALIDKDGNFQPTKLIEDVQVRIHRAIPSESSGGFRTERNPARTALDVYEFKLSRVKLFAQESGGLQPLAKEDTEFPLFMSHDTDIFDSSTQGFPVERELRAPLKSCSSCHFRPGVHSMLSRGRGEIVPSSDPNHETDATKRWKGIQYNWGLLQAIWFTNQKSASATK
jgi:hypothetical protein